MKIEFGVSRGSSEVLCQRSTFIYFQYVFSRFRVPQAWEFDSDKGFKAKVTSAKATSRGNDFRCSTCLKIMKCRPFDFALFSLIISTFSWFSDDILADHSLEIIKKALHVCKKSLHQNLSKYGSSRCRERERENLALAGARATFCAILALVRARS